MSHKELSKENNVCCKTPVYPESEWDDTSLVNRKCPDCGLQFIMVLPIVSPTNYKKKAYS